MYDFEYMTKMVDVLQKINDTQKDKIKLLSEKFAENMMNDHIIHMFGTGHSHMMGIELFARAGGLGNVDAMLDPDAITECGAIRSSKIERLPGLADIIYENYNITKGDIVVITSNSGRNSVPVEMALRCQKEGIYTVAVTCLQQSMATTSRHPSGKKLYECADCVIDNCVPSGDALMDIGGIKTGAGTSIASMFILDTAVTEAIKICMAKGFRPYVFQSQNVDGYNNDAIYARYVGRIKFFY